MLLKNNLKKIEKQLDANNVLTKLEERYCYSTDASNNKHKIAIPDLVVFVESINDVQKILKLANLYKIPIIPRGAGTNMVGACVCTEGGIILNFSKMNKILEINKENMTAKVEPGVILGDLKSAIEKINLFFPPDPSNFKVSTIGGGIAQASAGASAFKYGSIKDYILSLKIITADGKLLKLGVETSKDSMGYHLNQLIAGSEGTLGIIVEATLKLIPKPETTGLICSYFSDTKTTLNAVNNLLASNLYPKSIDFMDKNSIITTENFIKTGLNTEANNLVLIEFDGDKNSVTNSLEKASQILNLSHSIFTKKYIDIDDANPILNARRSSYAATTKLAPDVISDDIIVPRNKLDRIIDFCNSISNKYNLKMCLVGHIGNGNIHPQFAINLNNENEYRNYIKAKTEIYQKAVELGGSISAEHGVGLDKISYIDSIIDNNTLEYMKLIKKIFDPNNILNPNKIFKI